MSNGMDDRIRCAERDAAQGDLEADRRLHQERRRAGISPPGRKGIRYETKTVKVAVPLVECRICGRESPCALETMNPLQSSRAMVHRSYYEGRTMPEGFEHPEDADYVMLEGYAYPAGWSRMSHDVFGGRGSWSTKADARGVLCPDCTERVAPEIEKILRRSDA